MADFNQLNLPQIYGAAAEVQGMNLRNQLIQDQMGRDVAFRNQLAQVLQNSQASAAPGAPATVSPQDVNRLYAIDPERAIQFSQFQTQQNALALAQQKAQAEKLVTAADYVSQSKSPKTLAEVQFPQFKADYDAHHGDGAWDQLTDDQVRQMAEGIKAHFGSVAGIAPPAPVKLAPGEALERPSGGGAYETVATNAPKQEVEHVDAGDHIEVIDKRTGATIRTLPKGVTPTQEAKNFNPDESQLMGALAERGVSLPAGLRSQQQQKATFRGLLDRNPGKTPDEVADMVRTGQLDFNGAKRSTSQLATVAASADAASRQLEKNFASMEPLVSKVDKTGVPIVNRAFAQLKQNWQAGGDKDTASFMIYLRAVAGEYAKIKSGGTGSAAPAEGEMKDAIAVMNNAFSSGGFQGLKEAIMQEAANKRASYSEGIQAAAQRGAGVGAAQSEKTPAPTSGPVRVASDADYSKLPSGTEFIAPDGSHRRKP